MFGVAPSHLCLVETALILGSCAFIWSLTFIGSSSTEEEEDNSDRTVSDDLNENSETEFDCDFDKVLTESDMLSESDDSLSSLESSESGQTSTRVTKVSLGGLGVS